MSTCPCDELHIEVIEGFPNNVGSEWRYRVSDNISGESDTVVVTINGISLMENGTPLTVWCYAGNSGARTDCVSVTGDTAIVFRDRQGLWWVESTHIFPSLVGAGWVNR
jgi:hypothetical protein